MKKLTRVFAVLLTLALAVGLFAGCSSSPSTGSSTAPAASTGDSGDSGGGDAPAADTPNLDTSKQVELVLYVISNEPNRQSEVNANFDEILLDKLNATLKINWIGWAEYANKYPLLFSSGEEFDMAYAATWLNFSSLAQKGAFMNLDDLWPTYAPNNYSRQSETALRQATVDGHYYCIPTLYATYSAYGPSYRTDLVEGLDWNGKMDTFEDMEAYLDLIKENYPEIEPLEMYSSGSEIDDLFLLYNSIYFIKGSTNDFLFIDPAEENPELFTYYEYDKTPEFLEMMNRWNDKGFYPKSALSDTDSTKTENGKAAMKVHNIDSYSGLQIKRPEWSFSFNNFSNDLSNMAFTQDALVISNTAANPERALAFYDLITSDEEAHMAFYYGIEGESYELKENGQIEALNVDDFAFSALWTARTPEFTRDQYGSPEDIPVFKAGFDAAIQDGVGAQKYRSFAVDTSSIETEYAACQNVHQQYWWPLELGYTDPVSGLAEYQEKMEAAGIERVREVLQGQLNDYIATL